MIPSLFPFANFDAAAALAQPEWPPPEWADVAPLTMRQTWRDVPEPGLLPARVWMAATSTCFVILAELEDHDILTEAQRHNDPLWDLGDVFEVFVRHTERLEYYEFHTAPNGVTLDLRYPRLYASRANGVERYMLNEHHFISHVKCEPKINRWRIAMEIPAARLAPLELLQNESLWRFSFSRYDCGPNRPAVVSSTSPHSVADFHQGEDWPRFLAPPFIRE